VVLQCLSEIYEEFNLQYMYNTTVCNVYMYIINYIYITLHLEQVCSTFVVEDFSEVRTEPLHMIHMHVAK